MKMYLIILFFIIVWVFSHPNFLYSEDKTSKGEKLHYRFEYTMQGHTTGLILFLFRYRFFFHASASVLLSAQKIDQKTTQFNFHGIDKTGYLLCTRGFNGKRVFIGAADYSPLSDQQILDTGMQKFEKAAPEYYRFINDQKAFSFKILSFGEKTLGFKRDISGIHKDCSNDMKLDSESAVYHPNFYFKIYSILMDMIKVYNHSCLPGGMPKISELKPGITWESTELDFTGDINRIGSQAAKAVEDMVKFKQKLPFKLKYRVVSNTSQKITISGEARPAVEIFGSYKIDHVTRFIELQLPDGIVLLDKCRVEIWKTKGKGGFVEVSLSLVR